MKDLRLVACIWVLLFPFGCHSADAILAVTENSSYSYLDEGHIAGPATQVVELMLHTAGLSNYRFVLYPWARSYDLAAREKNVLIYPIVRTPERESHFQWVGKLATAPINLYKLRNRPEIAISNLEQAKDFTIAVVRDDARESYLVGHGFKRLAIASDNDDAFKLLISDKVQLIPMPERDAAAFCQSYGLAIDSLEVAFALTEFNQDIYVAFSLGTPSSIVDRASHAFESIARQGIVTDLMRLHRR
jgi:polar amino acid transport system substrate-binding protein